MTSKTPTLPTKLVSQYFSALGKVGGKKRWNGRTKKQMKEHMIKMAQLSLKKRFPQKTFEKH